MKKEIDSILVINRYLTSVKDDQHKSEVLRNYLFSRVNNLIINKNRPKRKLSLTFTGIPLYLLSL